MDFVQITDTANRLCVINTAQIVNVVQQGPHWQVFLTVGCPINPILIDDASAQKLMARLPGLPKKAGAAWPSSP